MKIIIFVYNNKFWLNLLVSIILLGCENINSKIGDFNYYSYKIEMFSLPKNRISEGILYNAEFCNDSNHNIYLAIYKSNNIFFVDINNDTVLNILFIPYPIKNLRSIHVIDTATFAINADTGFITYKNKQFNIYYHSDFNNDYYPLEYTNIVYIPSRDEIISGVLTYNTDLRQDDGIEYNSKFLMRYNLQDKNSTILSFKYPSQYHENNLGIPKFYLSIINDTDIIVSFEYDEFIYKLNVVEDNVQKIECKSNASHITAFYPKHGTKHEKIDALFNNDILSGGYGIAHYNVFTGEYFRLYRHALPEADNNYIFGTNDRIYHVIKKDKSGNYFEYKMPGGFFFVSSNLYLDRYNHCFYLKKYINNDKRKTTQCYVCRVNFWNFK